MGAEGRGLFREVPTGLYVPEASCLVGEVGGRRP